MASRMALFIAATMTITVTKSLADPHHQVLITCDLMECGPGYTCVERNSMGRCILANQKDGECPMYKCQANMTLCAGHECDGDNDCPGAGKCCWQCDNCYRCLTPPAPAPAPRSICGDQVCGRRERCVDIPVMCVTTPCNPVKRCVPTRCTLPAYSGRCKASFRRFYYDLRTRTCQRFTYGGCQGNANNFRTEAECLAACQL